MSRILIKQGYLNSDPARTVRIRIQDNRAVQTIKGLSDESGERRPEMNKKMTLEEADFMFSLCEPGVIDKLVTLSMWKVISLRSTSSMARTRGWCWLRLASK